MLAPQPMESEQNGAMSADDLEGALVKLDAEIAESELLMSVAPIRLITIGGSLAVRLCKNRDSTLDIECVLSPNIAAAEDYVKEFGRVVLDVAAKGGFANSWLNRDLELFVKRDRRERLFLESLEQNIVLYKGANLEVYAGCLSWALERKIRRIAHVRERRIAKRVDISDAAALIRLMDPPISAEYIRTLNLNGFEPAPTTQSIKNVADYYEQEYNEVGITGM